MKRLLGFMLSLVMPLIVWSADGDKFTEKTVEGVEMTFRVISEEDKTCQVGVGLGSSVTPAIAKETTGSITVPATTNNGLATQKQYTMVIM